MTDNSAATPTEPTTGRRAAVIVHPVKADVAALRVQVEAAEHEFGWEPSEWFETTPERLGDELAEDAIANGASLVIASGGDGTVRAVASTLAGTDVPLAIVPAGTGNLLARNLDIDVLDLRSAVWIAFGGITRHIDIGRARVERPDGSRESYAFTVLGGIGVDAGMIANTSDALKKRVGWVAYLDGILKTVLGGAAFHVRLKFDEGAPRSTRAQSVMIGNCGVMPGGILLLPDARVDDGALDTAVMRPRGFIGWLQILHAMSIQSGLLRHSEFGRKLVSENRKRVRALSYVQSRTVTFRVTSDPEEFEIDGEAVGEVVAGRVEVVPAALPVKVRDPEAPQEHVFSRVTRLVTTDIEGRVNRAIQQAQGLVAPVQLGIRGAAGAVTGAQTTDASDTGVSAADDDTTVAGATSATVAEPIAPDAAPTPLAGDAAGPDEVAVGTDADDAGDGASARA